VEPEERSEEDISNDTQAHTFTGLLAYGKEKGCTAKDVGIALKAVSITAFDPEKWSNMIAAIDGYVNCKV
jgi:hypothetical protein